MPAPDDGVAKTALDAAVSALESGEHIVLVSEGLHWRDFEGLAAEILSRKGYDVSRNVVLASPRREIDVAGTKPGIAVLVDCKHWRGSVSRGAAARQAERARRYAEENAGCRALPVVVTLYEQASRFVGGVPMVPVGRFASFVDDIPGHIDEMETVER